MKRSHSVLLMAFSLFALTAFSVFASGSQDSGTSAKQAPAVKSESTKPGWEWVLQGDGSFPEVDAAKVTGNIITAGSSTVFPLSEKIAELFHDEGYKGNLTIDSIGSGAGFERWAVAGETDVANASRAINAKETAAAKAIGREPIEFRVGTDAIAICVSSQNTFLTNVTKAQLVKIFSDAVYWSDVDPSWPKEQILRFTPGTDSGTFDYFVEHVFNKDRKPILSAKNLQMSEDDNILVQGIEGSPYGIGFFGFAYYEENKAKMKVVSVDGVAANKNNVDNGTYPFARPLFLYTSAKIMKEKPQVAAFIAYYLANVDTVIRKVGYFQARPEVIEASRKLWLDAMAGAY